nr:hypothetical protein [Tanacetum cinerariifolium]
MTTSSTSSLLPANSPTTNLPLATTTNLPPTTSTTTNLPSATSTTSHLPPATSSTSHLLPATSSTSHLFPSISTARACNINEADLFVVSVIGEENLLIKAEIEELDDVTMNEDVEANVNLELVKINTPRPSLYLHNETPGGTTYWEPNVDEQYLPLEGKRFDTIEECVEFYSVYSEKGGFEVKKSAQKKTKSGLVKSKYDMVFVPFTGIDNHIKCVNFGSRMLLKEDTEAYTWLLKSFMTAHEKQPTMVVTDQDGAMKRAIEAVLTESKHRLCMWHIMQKVPAKICPEIYDETDFKERFGKLVWNMFMEPLEFEEKWSKLVEDFGLQNHKWMRKMFDLRHIQEVLDFRTFDSAPKLHTKLTIEIHACKVYTRTISLLVQKEIYEGCWACQIQEFKKDEGCEIVKVRDIRAGAYRTIYKEEGKETVIQEKDKVVDYK